MVEYRTVFFRITASQAYEYLKRAVLDYLLLQNMLLILIHKNYKEHNLDAKSHPNLFALLTHANVMRSLLWQQEGGQKKDDIQKLRDHYQDDALFADMLKLGFQLKDKNIRELVKKIKGAFSSYFTRRKAGEDAKPPKAKKLRNISHFSVPVDMERVSFKRKNIISIQVRRGKSFALNFKHENLLKIVGNFKAIKQVEVVFKHGSIYLAFNYEKPSISPESILQRPSKYAALDLGINRLLAIYIHDKDTPSFLIDGSLFSAYNAEFNRDVAKLKSEIAVLENKRQRIELEARKDQFVSVAEMVRQDPEYQALLASLAPLKKRLSSLFMKRYAFIDTNLKKLARRVLEDLQQLCVTELVTSRNIIYKKSQGCNIGRANNQKFYYLPLGKLLDLLKLYAGEYGIRVIDDIDEAYTSKTSCLSACIEKAQTELINNKSRYDKVLRSDVFKGKRVKRGLFKDEVLGVSIHADINAAVNILKLYLGHACDLDFLKSRLFKLANPILIGSNALKCLLDRPHCGLCV